jgi:glycosyltransferase involved in cell wall biosynthesis
VIIPAYRCARHIGETLDSVFAQTFRDFEVVVVNDGCPETELLEQALRPYIGKIKYIKQANAGAAIARNSGVQASTGEMLAFLDGDDVWEPEYLAKQVTFLLRGEFDMVYCDAELVDDGGSLGATHMQTAPSQGVVSVRSLLDIRCNVITSGTVIRRDAFGKAGGFENSRVLAEDFHLWVRVARTGARIGYQTAVLLKYRVSNEGLSGDEISRVERAIDVFRRVERDVELSDDEVKILRRRLRGFETDLSIARAKSHLLEGKNGMAAAEFAKAASRRPRPKIAAAAVLSVIAPGPLRREIGSAAGRATHENPTQGGHTKAD